MACRWLLEGLATGRSMSDERWVTDLDGVLAKRDSSSTRLLRALTALTPADTVPTLLLVSEESISRPTTWIEAAARSLSQIATAVPRLPVALAVAGQDFAAYLRETSESHAKAILRETVVAVDGLEAPAVVQRLAEAGIADHDGLSESVQRLTRDGASEELVQVFIEATAGNRAVASRGGVDDDRARSAAERFLFERLESLASTAGLFEPNGTLNFCFGPRQAEVDLVCRELSLAVEIDGYYHFQSMDDYRRDRRKDVELQRQGYLVLRFLADDVVARLEEILETILNAITFRRKHVTARNERT
jgi:hypothetical protein